MAISRSPLVSLLSFMCMVLIGNSDFASDRAECTNQLMGLATCITYVEGTAKAPTPDCCTGFRQVTGKSLKCLCILVQDRDQPELGIKINVTLALQLPKKCDIPTNISDCPRLLKLPKDSPETKMFEQFAKELSDSPPTSTSTVKGTPSTAMASTTPSKGTRSQSRGVDNKKWIQYFLLPLFFLLNV